MNTSAFAEPIAHIGHQAAANELADRIARLTSQDGATATAIPSLFLHRASQPKPCVAVVYEPRLCFVAQGSKRATLAGETYHYDPLHYLVVSMTLPMLGEVVEASPEKPFLGLRFDLDLEQIGALVLETDRQALAVRPDRGLYAARAGGPLLDAVLRLMRLLDHPDDVPVLAPMALREIYYRVLVDDLGHRLREIATAGSRGNRIARAVSLLHRHYLEPLRIDDLAQQLHMSTSSLHHQFKAATAMSPLQYHKQLRLHEARRLMLMEGCDAAVAAQRVGYESPSQFNREYKRAFGAPPRREVVQVRAAGG